jgi:hypothetical protein
MNGFFLLAFPIFLGDSATPEPNSIPQTTAVVFPRNHSPIINGLNDLNDLNNLNHLNILNELSAIRVFNQTNRTNQINEINPSNSSHNALDIVNPERYKGSFTVQVEPRVEKRGIGLVSASNSRKA